VPRRRLGRVAREHHVLITGLAAQYLMDQENRPSASDLAEGLLYIAERLRAA
jgi:hypothetical protein